MRQLQRAGRDATPRAANKKMPPAVSRRGRCFL